MGDKIIIATNVVNVSESFVHRENKRVGAGSGETRLYLGPQASSEVEQFIEFDDAYLTTANNKQYATCKETIMMTRDNLIEYHESVKNEYLSGEFKDTNGKIENLYDARKNEILGQNEVMRFEVFNQAGEKDSARLYMGSVSSRWDLLRRIALPRISCIKIDKLLDEETGEQSYVLSLHKRSNKEIENRIWENRNYYQGVITKKEQEINDNKQLSDTEKKEMILARRGQGKFRRQVLSLMGACPFTGISNPRLLRASHCIPWAECETASDRLDGYNGLALTPTYDLLYDQGYITFDIDGNLMISKYLGEKNANALSLVAGRKYINDKRQLKMRERFLEYHRKYVFKDNQKE